MSEVIFNVAGALDIAYHISGALRVHLLHPFLESEVEQRPAASSSAGAPTFKPSVMDSLLLQPAAVTIEARRIA